MVFLLNVQEMYHNWTTVSKSLKSRLNKGSIQVEAAPPPTNTKNPLNMEWAVPR